MPTTTTPFEVENLRVALDEAENRANAAANLSVKVAVRYVAALTRLTYPDAVRVELEASEQGDWLLPVSVDGDQAKAEAIEDGLFWAASCIYDAHRTASPALHSSINTLTVTGSDSLYINIDEALDDN